MTNSRRTSHDLVYLIAGSGTGPRSGGWETLLYSTLSLKILFCFNFCLMTKAVILKWKVPVFFSVHGSCIQPCKRAISYKVEHKEQELLGRTTTVKMRTIAKGNCTGFCKYFKRKLLFTLIILFHNFVELYRKIDQYNKMELYCT